VGALPEPAWRSSPAQRACFASCRICAISSTALGAAAIEGPLTCPTVLHPGPVALYLIITCDEQCHVIALGRPNFEDKVWMHTPCCKMHTSQLACKLVNCALVICNVTSRPTTAYGRVVGFIPGVTKPCCAKGEGCASDAGSSPESLRVLDLIFKLYGTVSSEHIGSDMFGCMPVLSAPRT